VWLWDLLVCKNRGTSPSGLCLEEIDILGIPLPGSRENVFSTGLRNLSRHVDSDFELLLTIACVLGRVIPLPESAIPLLLITMFKK
jgi:hypothetical protein